MLRHGLFYFRFDYFPIGKPFFVLYSGYIRRNIPVKGYSRIVIMLIVALAVLAGCQSNASVSSTEIIAPAPVAAIPAAPVPAPAPAPAEEAVAEEPAEAAPAEEVCNVVSSYEYSGYSMTIEAFDGYALISVPSIVTKADVDAFMANEVAVYGSMLDGVTYSYEDGTIRINYPAGVSEAERRSYANMFACDVIAMASSVFSIPESMPVAVTHSYQGYELTAEINVGSAALFFPDFITSAEAESFFAVENAAYGDVLGSVHYTIPAAGNAVFTYPESVSISDVLTYTSLFVTDLIAYIG